MADTSTASPVDDYIARFPTETLVVLQRIRAILSESAPGTVETMSCGIPTFDLQGKHLVHFGGFAKHVGFYPALTGTEAFKEELRRGVAGEEVL
jgi:uncharacterized protein YdhG (YjbR/CyaY superfamily)